MLLKEPQVVGTGSGKPCSGRASIFDSLFSPQEFSSYFKRGKKLKEHRALKMSFWILVYGKIWYFQLPSWYLVLILPRCHSSSWFTVNGLWASCWIHFFLGGLLIWSILTTRDHLEQPSQIIQGNHCWIDRTPHRKNGIFLHCHRKKPKVPSWLPFTPTSRQCTHCCNKHQEDSAAFLMEPSLGTILELIQFYLLSWVWLLLSLDSRWPHREVICIDKVHIEWFFWGIFLCLCGYIYIQIHWWCIRCPAPYFQVAVDVARCLCNLVQAGNSALKTIGKSELFPSCQL